MSLVKSTFSETANLYSRDKDAFRAEFQRTLKSQLAKAFRNKGNLLAFAQDNNIKVPLSVRQSRGKEALMMYIAEVATNLEMNARYGSNLKTFEEELEKVAPEDRVARSGHFVAQATIGDEKKGGDEKMPLSKPTLVRETTIAPPPLTRESSIVGN